MYMENLFISQSYNVIKFLQKPLKIILNRITFSCYECLKIPCFRHNFYIYIGMYNINIHILNLYVITAQHSIYLYREFVAKIKRANNTQEIYIYFSKLQYIYTRAHTHIYNIYVCIVYIHIYNVQLHMYVILRYEILRNAEQTNSTQRSS